MKRFARTFVGKLILFVACSASLFIFVVSVFGLSILLRDDMKFYTVFKQEMEQDIIAEYQLEDYGYDILWYELNEQQKPTYNEYNFLSNVNYRITDANGNVLKKSAGYVESSNSFSLTYGVIEASNKAVKEIYRHHNGPIAFDEYATYYVVEMSVIEGSYAEKNFEFASLWFRLLYSIRYSIYVITLLSFGIGILSFVALMYASGKKADSEEVVQSVLNKIPLEIVLAFWGIAGSCLLYLGIGVCFYNTPNDIGLILVGGLLCLVCMGIAVGICMCIAIRVKQHVLFKNTIIYPILRFVWKIVCRIQRFIKKILQRIHRFAGQLFRSLPLISKTALAYCALSFLEILCVVWSDGEQALLVIVFTIEKIILLPLILFVAYTLRQLQRGGQALADGDLSYHTDTDKMLWDFKMHGENLNSIAAGMAIAVEDRLKSERMKTELITNVSHDIKTPLTSIINYASLIGEQASDNAVITEYTEVLVRQSAKLKRLLEDLVEASKASTGNLEVEVAPCDASIFINQTSGEYEEKLSNAELKLITKLPEKELRIMADGRRMWRIFDNLMNNICKYSLPGSRVYLSLEEQDKNAVISFKNTSKEALDISEEELMERFTRGDSSRNTEGNGLGLSIAKSMAELQGGSLKIVVDGDLFKSVLTFPLI